ncbi:RNA polymerase sigma-70 factor [Pedobacter ginsengisoli]|uniref:RNA polymerase sigma-70 factor n=1 Tax=Pedobacter ginsengisoli TaxID=363852 RepID=UPI00254D1CCC|nr:RNA polymerase sigma-70 factor [Pedobacter ginsengisoli]
MAAYSAYSDQELTVLLKQGDQYAYAEIYGRYVKGLVRFAETKLYSLEDARDLIQDVFVGLWSDRDSLEINESLKSYLFGIVRFQIINRIRKNIVREDYAAKLRALSPAYVSLEEELELKELESNIKAKLSELPEKTQAIFQKSREQHLSIKEIAEELNLSEQTVKNQISIALKYLKKSFSAFFFTIFW